MKVLVYPARMEIGGSQLNAIELAAQMATDGHDVVLYAPSGEMNGVAHRLGLEVIRSFSETRSPNPRTVAALVSLVRRRGIDIVHGYEWGPSVELALGPYAVLGTPMITTVMSMDVPDIIPLQPPLVVGTAELAEQQYGRRSTHLAEPWIDLIANRPEATDRRATRSRLGLADDDVVLAVVCRLTTDLDKAAGVVAAIETVATLNAEPTPHRRHRLIVAGGGPQLADLARHAAEANTAAGFEEVLVTGPLIDPRPVYDCADVILGMGSSALKGLAFGKPLVVQGTGGYWLAFGPETMQVFAHQGFFGNGTAATTGEASRALRGQLASILEADQPTRTELGDLGRRYVENGFSLRAASARHVELYEHAVAYPPSPHDRVGAFARTAREATKLNVALARDATRRVRSGGGGTTAVVPRSLGAAPNAEALV